MELTFEIIAVSLIFLFVVVTAIKLLYKYLDKYEKFLREVLELSGKGSKYQNATEDW